jgi:predicted nucleotidyltransferase
MAYLFGSQVDGVTGPDSDYDFGVLVEGSHDALALSAHLTHALAVALETDRVDVVILNTAPIELAYAVIAQGLLLYERDLATRVEYEAGVLTRYGDYLPVLRAQRRDVLQGDNHAARIQRYRAALGRTLAAMGQTGRAEEKKPGGV